MRLLVSVLFAFDLACGFRPRGAYAYDWAEWFLRVAGLGEVAHGHLRYFGVALCKWCIVGCMTAGTLLRSIVMLVQVCVFRLAISSGYVFQLPVDGGSASNKEEVLRAGREDKYTCGYDGLRASIRLPL